MKGRRLAIAAGVLAAACSSSTAPSSDLDASAPDASDASDASDAAPIVDAGTSDVTLFNYNDCTNVDFDQNDQTAPGAARTIVFSFRAAAQQYAPRCIKIRKGQSVKWQGSFVDHPLVSAGGDVPSPIDGLDAGVVTFPVEGWFGFECQVHESPTEYGAILVVP